MLSSSSDMTRSRKSDERETHGYDTERTRKPCSFETYKRDYGDRGEGFGVPVVS
jgi:hypothetical protein